MHALSWGDPPDRSDVSQTSDLSDGTPNRDERKRERQSTLSNQPSQEGPEVVTPPSSKNTWPFCCRDHKRCPTGSGDAVGRCVAVEVPRRLGLRDSRMHAYDARNQPTQTAADRTAPSQTRRVARTEVGRHV